MCDVRSFLGLVGYYRKYIKDYSKIASPLTDLTKKEVAFQWTDECESAFQTLQQKLLEAPILAYPDYNNDYTLYTDASSKAIGMVLSQVQDGKECVISYGGKKLSSAEKKFSTTERECLAVIVASKHFEPYLRGVQVTVVTDHVALKWILNQKKPKGRIARWVAFCSSLIILLNTNQANNSGMLMASVDVNMMKIQMFQQNHMKVH